MDCGIQPYSAIVAAIYDLWEETWKIRQEVKTIKSLMKSK